MTAPRNTTGGRGSQYERGRPPAELWGVARGPRTRNRGAAAKARRAARKAAKRMGVTFKGFMRMVAARTQGAGEANRMLLGVGGGEAKR